MCGWVGRWIWYLELVIPSLELVCRSSLMIHRNPRDVTAWVTMCRTHPRLPGAPLAAVLHCRLRNRFYCNNCNCASVLWNRCYCQTICLIYLKLLLFVHELVRTSLRPDSISSPNPGARPQVCVCTVAQGGCLLIDSLRQISALSMLDQPSLLLLLTKISGINYAHLGRAVLVQLPKKK